MTSRRFLAATLVLVLSTAACSGPEAGSDRADQGAGVAFAPVRFDEALARAKSEKRLLLVDVYTDWCGWCKKLDGEVFSNARVANAARGLVAVRVNAEKGGEEVARRYGIEGYPTILFVDGSGAVVKRVDGYVDVDEMLRILSGLPKA
jgi:thiol:disulfide interchange protein